MSLTVVGLGLRRESLTLGAMDEMRKASRVVLRTGKCEAAKWLQENGIIYETNDDMYADFDDFTGLYDDMANRILEMSKTCDVAYCVLDLRDESVARLMCKTEVKLIAGVPVDAELTCFNQGPFVALAACDIDVFRPSARVGTIVREVDSRIAASEVKLKLLERYPFDSPVVVASSRGIERVELDEMDRLDAYDHTTCVCVPAETCAGRLQTFDMEQLMDLCKTLKNTPVSLEQLKACCERVKIIGDDDDDGIISNLGNIMLETVRICRSAQRRGRFSADDVITDACRRILDGSDTAKNV